MAAILLLVETYSEAIHTNVVKVPQMLFPKITAPVYLGGSLAAIP